jgi:hypothetical protein
MTAPLRKGALKTGQPASIRDDIARFFGGLVS